MNDREPFERCPVCDDTVAVRIDLGWLKDATLEDLQKLPKVACGAPWHYVNRNVKPKSGFTWAHRS